jgi:hypothetical protein
MLLQKYFQLIVARTWDWGQWGQILADQLNLLQPRGQIMPITPKLNYLKKLLRFQKGITIPEIRKWVWEAIKR